MQYKTTLLQPQTATMWTSFQSCSFWNLCNW